MSLPAVHWSIDGRGVPVEDWTASDIAFGGFDAFSGRIPEKFLRKFPSSIAQGAIIRGLTDHGDVAWEGRMASPPYLDDGIVQIDGKGHSSALDEESGRLLFQSRDTAQFADAGGTPYNRAGSATINASTEEGALIFEVSPSTIANGDLHYLAVWIPGVKLRRVACEISWLPAGAMTYSALVDGATGPTGTPNNLATAALNSFANGGTLDTGELTPTYDMLLIGLKCTNIDIRGAPLRVLVRNLRINGDIGNAADSLGAHEVMSAVGRRAGLDVSGISVGPGATSSRYNVWGWAPVKINPYEGRYPEGVGAQWYQDGVMWAPIGTVEQGVAFSALNVLPLDWNDAWSACLNYVAMLNDWRWGVWEDIGGGPLLEFAPWGPSWTVHRGRDAKPQLKPIEVYNKVRVQYHTTAGAPAEYVARANPDPLLAFGIDKTFPVQLSDPQADTTLAATLAGIALARLSDPNRMKGIVEIVDAHDAVGRGNAFSVRSGTMVAIEDYEPSRGALLRVSKVERRPDGVTLGIEQDTTIDDFLAAEALGASRGWSIPGRFDPISYRRNQ